MEAKFGLWSAKTKDTGAVWAAYLPIWDHEKRKWQGFRTFKTKEGAKRHAESLSSPK